MRLMRAMGPGLITGAADDDPSGIATYSQTGAQFGYGQLWTALYQIPLLIAVQEACARIGAVTGQGLAAVIKRHYSRKVLAGVVLWSWSPTRSTSAPTSGRSSRPRAWSWTSRQPCCDRHRRAGRELGGIRRLQELRRRPEIPGPGATGLPGDGSDDPRAVEARYSRPPSFRTSSSASPSCSSSPASSAPPSRPYMFFWEASEEVEEEIRASVPMDDGRAPRASQQGSMRNLRIDNAVGMVISELAQWFIIIDHRDGAVHPRREEYWLGGRRRSGAGAAGDRLPERRPARPRHLRDRGHRARACWRSRCSPARPPMPWPRR